MGIVGCCVFQSVDIWVSRSFNILPHKIVQNGDDDLRVHKNEGGQIKRK